jgi:hypothetical protein
VAKLVKGLQEALGEDFLPSSEAEEWAGKLEFLTLSSGFHRVGRAAIEEFRAFRAATRSGGPGSSVEERGLPESFKKAMRFRIILFPRLPPRTIDVRNLIAPPLVVYTDAAYEPDSAIPAGMGACVFDPNALEGLQWVVAGCEVGPEILEHWRKRKQYIGQLEALAAVAVYYSLANGVENPGGAPTHVMRNRDVLHFVDNYGSLASLIKKRSKDPDITRQAHVLTAIFIALDIRPWFEFVASALNVADTPLLGFPIYHPSMAP